MPVKTIKTSCRKGQILRSAYTRKGYTKKSGSHVKRTHVSAECITNLGKPGKGTKLFELKDHYLSEHGYHNVDELSLVQRKSALMSLIKHFLPTKGQMITYKYVINALNARYVLNRNTNPKIARIFKHDQRMISAMYKKIKTAKH